MSEQVIHAIGGPLDDMRIKTTTDAVRTLQWRDGAYVQVYYRPDGTRDDEGLRIFRPEDALVGSVATSEGEARG